MGLFSMAKASAFAHKPVMHIAELVIQLMATALNAILAIGLAAAQQAAN